MLKVNMVGPAGTLKVEDKDVRSYESRGYVVTDKPKATPAPEVKKADKTKTKKIAKPGVSGNKKPAGDAGFDADSNK